MKATFNNISKRYKSARSVYFTGCRVFVTTKQIYRLSCALKLLHRGFTFLDVRKGAEDQVEMLLSLACSSDSFFLIHHFQGGRDTCRPDALFLYIVLRGNIDCCFNNESYGFIDYMT